MGQYILNGWKIRGLFGHMWLHGDPLHLLGNLWILLIFGSAVCSKVGNRFFFPMYLLFGLVAAVSHLVFRGGLMLGASGAIFGVIGMFLVFFPENEVSCLWIWFLVLGYARRFSVSSYWIILMWVVFDVGRAILSRNVAGGVAYCAHIGGFVTGLAVGIVLLKAKWVTMETYEKSLLELIGIEKRDRPNHSETTSTEVAFWEGQIQAIEAAKTEPKTIPLERQIPLAEPPRPERQFIRLVCPCGKKIRAPALYAGKTGRCPECGCDVEIPEQKAVEPQATAPQTNRPTAESIRFVCPCGKRVKVPAAFAGKSGRCPKCGSPLKIPQKPLA
jgi:membrane associated rhomboid family serine protease